MKKILTVVVMIFVLGGSAYSQQDPMFTKYMFNSLIFNPAYAGSKDYMSVGILHRTQWANFEGAPTTQTVTLHTPLKNERVGVGFSMINDVIGPSNSFGANFSYAYRIPMGSNGAKLSIGLQAGIENYRADFNQLNLQTDVDPTFLNVNQWNPNFGAGIFYYSRNFYAGVSCPQLVEYDLADQSVIGQTDIYARNYRHFFFTMGTAIPIKGDNLVFKPSLLVKNVGVDKQFAPEIFQNIGAPTEFDIDLSLLFQQTFWIGASFRAGVQSFGSGAKTSYDSADVWFSWNMPNGLRLGAAYDYPLTEINTVTAGSFEVMLGYEFNYVTKATVTPRYF